MISAEESRAFVEAALGAAQITPHPEEVEVIISDYPKLREIADALFEFADDLEPAVTFDPLDYYPPMAGN